MEGNKKLMVSAVLGLAVSRQGRRGLCQRSGAESRALSALPRASSGCSSFTGEGEKLSLPIHGHPHVFFSDSFVLATVSGVKEPKQELVPGGRAAGA